MKIDGKAVVEMFVPRRFVDREVSVGDVLRPLDYDETMVVTDVTEQFVKFEPLQTTGEVECGSK